MGRTGQTGTQLAIDGFTRSVPKDASTRLPFEGGSVLGDLIGGTNGTDRGHCLRWMNSQGLSPKMPSTNVRCHMLSSCFQICFCFMDSMVISERLLPVPNWNFAVGLSLPRLQAAL